MLFNSYPFIFGFLPLTLLIFFWSGRRSPRFAIAWLVLASLPFFLVLPFLLKSGCGFWPSMGLASLVSVIAYAGMTYCLNRLGIVG